MRKKGNRHANWTNGPKAPSRCNRCCSDGRSYRDRRDSRQQNCRRKWRLRFSAEPQTRQKSSQNFSLNSNTLFPVKRPPRIARVLSQQDRNQLAERASYTGSPEHKNQRSWLGLPCPRVNTNTGEVGFKQNATICPLVNGEDRERATVWVRHAIRNGQYDPNIWANGFPKAIWYRESANRYWFGRLTQQGAGDAPKAEYKGWPISRSEWRENFG